MRTDAPKPGDLIAGKYRVRSVLSRSRGVLCDALHVDAEQRFAVRLLSPGLVDPKQLERFKKEAKVLAKIESEHVARIADVGSLADGSFYVARQLLEGTDLASHLKKQGAFPLREAILLVLQAAEGVAHAHAHGVVLRALEPSHLFLTKRLGGAPIVKIIDFGTAKVMRDLSSVGPDGVPAGETTSATMVWLSACTSPELVSGQKGIDQRADVWSLGAILYQMLTARPPFAGEAAVLIHAIAKTEPMPITTLRRDVPAEIDEVMSWALAKSPSDRFADVHAFAHALAPFAPPEGQVLITRIGEIVEEGKARRAAHGDVDVITMDSDELIEEADEDDDEQGQPTRMMTSDRMPKPLQVKRAQSKPPAPLPPPKAPKKAAPAPVEEEPELFQATQALTPGFVPSSPVSVFAAAAAEAEANARAHKVESRTEVIGVSYVPKPASRGPVFAGAAADPAPIEIPIPPQLEATAALPMPPPRVQMPPPVPAVAVPPPSSRRPEHPAPAQAKPASPKHTHTVPTDLPAFHVGDDGVRRIAIVAVAATILGLSLFATVLLLKSKPTAPPPAPATSASAPVRAK